RADDGISVERDVKPLSARTDRIPTPGIRLVESEVSKLDLIGPKGPVADVGVRRARCPKIEARRSAGCIQTNPVFPRGRYFEAACLGESSDFGRRRRIPGRSSDREDE